MAGREAVDPRRVDVDLRKRACGTELGEPDAGRVAVSRFGQPAEVARLVAWLVRENSYVTGQAILLDGAL